MVVYDHTSEINSCLYETHFHTSPVSKCAAIGVKESLEKYKQLGYSGVFITNHFIDGNINIDKSLPYEQLINFYFSDYEEGVVLGQKLGISVFCGVEMSYLGTDFLVYGLDKQWFLSHPEIKNMKKSELLSTMADCNALLIHAHPFREASYIDHIRLFPRHVHGVEIYNANRTEFENKMAEIYAENYNLLPFAGSDNHNINKRHVFGGMFSSSPLTDETDFVEKVKNGFMTPFCRKI